LPKPGAHRVGPTLVCQNQVHKEEADEPVEAVIDEVVDADEESLTPQDETLIRACRLGYAFGTKTRNGVARV
jgi:hypothetical protein